MTTSKPSPSRSAFAAGVIAALLLAGPATRAVAQSAYTWTGNGTDNNWSTGADWGGTAPSSPQAILNFAGSTRTTSNNDFADWSAGYRIFFNSGAGPFTLTGNATKFYDYGGAQALIENDSSNLQTVSFMFAAGNSFGISLYANTGDLLFNGSAIYLDGNSTLTTNANSGRTITISNAIQNAGGNLYVTGPGSTILTGNNTYTGTTTINSGKLQLGDGTSGHDGSIGGASIVDNANLTYNLVSSSNYSGVISGTGSVTKVGSGALTFSGAAANTYAGTTTITGGTLVLSKTTGVNAIAGNITLGDGTGSDILQLTASNQISDASIITLGGTAAVNRGWFQLNGNNETIGGLSSATAGAGLVADEGASNSTLTLNVTGSLDFSGLIRNASSANGTLALIKTGNGIQTLSGNNTYTGGTQINGGILQVGSSLALSNTGNISFGGGTLQYSANGTGTDYSARIKNSASAITLDTNGQSVTLASAIDSSNTAGLIKNGSGTLTLSGANAYSGETDLNAGTLQVNLATTGNGTAGTYYVGNGGTTGTAATLSLGAAINLANPVWINPGNGTNRIVSATNTAGTTATYSGTLTLNSAATITSTNTGALLAFAGSNSIAVNSNQLTVNGSGNTTISEVLGSANAAGGSLYKDGTGTLILQNTSNTYTGTSSGLLNGNGTQINAGTLGIYGDGSLGVAPAGAYANIQFTGNATLQDTANDITLNANRNISIATGATATFDTNGHALTINGIISSSGAANVVKAGAGRLNVNSSGGGLANNSTWTVQGGSSNSTTGLYDSVLAIAAGNVLGNATGNVLNLSAGTLQFTANGGSGYLSTRTINVTASGGAISDGGFAPGDATSGGSQIAPAIAIATGSGLNLVSTNALKLYSAISGNGTLTKFGNGTATLLGSNTYTGLTTLKAGNLNVGSAGALGGGGNLTFSGGTLQYSSSNQVDYGSRILNSSSAITIDTNGQTVTLSNLGSSNTGGLVKNGTGTLKLSSNMTFTGGVMLNGGTLGIYEGSSLGPIPGSPATELTFGGNSTLQFQQTPTALPLNANRLIVINPGVTATIDTQSYSPSIAGVISGATGALVKIGSGTLTLNGADTYGGGTSVNAGTLQLGSATALGSTAGTLAVNGATLSLGGFSATVGALTSAGGTFSGFTLGTNALTASSASISGTNYIGITNAATASVGTYSLITSSGGGLAGTFQFSGAQDLTVPVNSIIAKTNTGFVRLTLNNTGTAEQVVVSNSLPANTINIMPLGASITFGSSATGTAKNGDVITSYNGGGYHTQLYQDLVNDGRFNPNFVGSSTSLGAVNPSGTNILTTAGQTASEGHPGYRTSQILYNLNHNDGDSTANGGFWLASGNGRNPDYVPLNVGGNDFLGGLNQNTSAVNRYDAIISEVNTLRPGVATIVGSLAYRTDVGAAQNTYFNPYVQGIVYNHVLAGQDVRFVDFYTLLSPGNSTGILSSDGIHPTQAGYNMMANVWYESTIYGAAYWKGGQGGNWSTVNGTDTNWAMNRAGTIDRQKSLTDSTTRTSTGAYADVFFNSNNSALPTTLDADTTVRSLNFAGGATGSVTIAGSNTLTIGAGGITVQQGTGTHNVSANVALGADQTWGNVSSNNFTVSGVISGGGNLTIAGGYSVQTAGAFTSNASTSLEIVATNTSTFTGTGAIVLSGNNTYTGTTTVTSGTLILNGTNSSSGVTVQSGATLGGSGKIAGAISGAGLVSPGNSPGILAASQVNPSGGLGFAFEFTATGGPTYGNSVASLNDVLHLSNASAPFVTDLNGSNAVSIYLNLTTVSAGNTFQGGFFTDKSVDFLSSINSAAFAYYVKGNGGGTHTYNGFSSYTLAEYNAGFSINLSTIQVGTAAFADGTVTNGYISQMNVVPEPATWALLAGGFTVVMLFRRRR